MPAEWDGWLVLLRWQLERPMYDFKNSFSFAFVYIHRAKYIFSRDMFCLPYFWAKIHGVMWPKFSNWNLGIRTFGNKKLCLFMRDRLTKNEEKWFERDHYKKTLEWRKDKHVHLFIFLLAVNDSVQCDSETASLLILKKLLALQGRPNCRTALMRHLDLLT